MSVGAPEILLDAEAINEPGLEPVAGEIVARSPLELFWRRFRTDRVAIVSLAFIVALVLAAVFAPLLIKVVGAPAPNAQNTSALSSFGTPTGPSHNALWPFITVLGGALLAMLGSESCIWLWDTKSYQPVHRLFWRGPQPSSLAFSPDGRILASGSYDQNIWLWDVSGRTAHARHVLEGHTGEVNCLTFTPDGKMLYVSNSGDRSVSVIDTDTRQIVAIIPVGEVPKRINTMVIH